MVNTKSTISPNKWFGKTHTGKYIQSGFVDHRSLASNFIHLVIENIERPQSHSLNVSSHTSRFFHSSTLPSSPRLYSRRRYSPDRLLTTLPTSRVINLHLARLIASALCEWRYWPKGQTPHLAECTGDLAPKTSTRKRKR